MSILYMSNAFIFKLNVIISILLNNRVATFTYTFTSQTSTLCNQNGSSHFLSKKRSVLSLSSFDVYEEESNPISQFGTRAYWDETYEGRGDFPMEEYSWYYGWDDIIKKIWMDTVVPNLKIADDPKSSKILIPGIGNDSIIIDLYGSGWKYITAFDYTQSAIDRQIDMMYTPDLQRSLDKRDVQLYKMDATDLNENEVITESILMDTYNNEDKVEKTWNDAFNIVFEKGTLDAIYLSSADDDERLQLAVTELTRVLQKDGIFVSCSGVIPEDLRRDVFSTNEWEWLRDGSEDLQAGCFVWKKK